MISTGLQLALDAVSGNQSRLASICGVAQPTVWGWINKGRGILPAECVIKVEAGTGVSRHDLRPDLYPREDVTA